MTHRLKHTVSQLNLDLTTPLEVHNFYKILTGYACHVETVTERDVGVDRGVDPEVFPEWHMARELLEYIEAANDTREISRFNPQREFKRPMER